MNKLALNVLAGLMPLCMVYGAEPIQNENAATSRLLVNIDPNASFSAEQFANASKAKLVEIDPSYPYKPFQEIFVECAFVVLSKSLNEASLEALSKRYGYRFVNFVNGSIDEALTEAQLLRETGPKCISDIPPLPQDVVQSLYQLMDKVDRVFTNHNITYWLGGGTLLGAIRHGGLIKHDDDLDTYILESEEAKINEIEEDLAKEGLSIYKKDIYVIYETNGTKIEHQPYNFPCLDVFVMHLEKGKEEKEIYAHKAPYFYFHFRKDRFSRFQIENIYRAPFGHLSLPVPANPELNLNANYGSSQQPELWKNYSVEPGFNHREGVEIKRQGACLVKIDDYSPASWD